MAVRPDDLLAAVRRAAILLEGANRFHLNWSRLRGAMTGGYTGEGGAPTAVVMGRAFPLKAVPGQNIRDLDQSSLRCAMWTAATASKLRE
jgi:hypothetical protein